MDSLIGKVSVKIFNDQGRTYSKTSREVFERKCNAVGFTIDPRNGIAHKDDTNLEEVKELIDQFSGKGYVVLEDEKGGLHHRVSLAKSIKFVVMRTKPEKSLADTFARYSRFRTLASVCTDGGLDLHMGEDPEKVRRERAVKLNSEQDLTKYGTKSVSKSATITASTHRVIPERKSNVKIASRASTSKRVMDTVRGMTTGSVVDAELDHEGTCLFSREGIGMPLSLSNTSLRQLMGGHDSAEAVGLRSWSIVEFTDATTTRHMLITHRKSDGSLETVHLINYGTDVRLTLMSRLRNIARDSYQKQETYIRGFALNAG